MGDALRGVPRASDDPVTDAIRSVLAGAGDSGAARAELDAAAGASPATVRRRLDTLTALGTITRTGTGRGTRYHLVDQATGRHDDQAAERTTDRAGELVDQDDDASGRSAGGRVDAPAVRRRPRVILPATTTDDPPEPEPEPADDDRLPARVAERSPAVRRSAPVVLPPPRPGDPVETARRGTPERRSLLPAGFLTGGRAGVDPRARVRTLGIVAGLVVGLVLVDGVLVLLYQHAGLGITITVVLALVGGVGAWLRRRRDRVLTIAIAYIEAVLGIAAAVAVWLFLNPGAAGLAVQEHVTDCSTGFQSQSCVWSTNDTTAVLLISAAVALFLFGVTAPPAWYWLGKHPSRPRGRRAVAAGLALVLVAGGVVGWAFWNGTNGFGSQQAAGQTPDDVMFHYMDTVSDTAPDELDMHDRYARFPPSLEATTCHNTAFRRQIIDLVWQYRQWDDQHPDDLIFVHAWTEGEPTIHGDRAIVRAQLGGEDTYDPSSTTYTFTLVREHGVLSDAGWRVCGMTWPKSSSTGSGSTSSSGGTSGAGTPSPSPNPPPATQTAPASPSLNPTAGLPYDMTQCAPDDPYKSLGWYTCPPN